MVAEYNSAIEQAARWAPLLVAAGGLAGAILIMLFARRLVRGIADAAGRRVAATDRLIRSWDRRVAAAVGAFLVAFVCLWLAAAQRRETVSRGQWALLGVTATVAAIRFGWQAHRRD